MISGILTSLLMLGPVPSQGLDLPTLLAGLELDADAEVRFTETRQSDLLVDELEVRGTLRRDPRGRLLRTIASPVAETQILSEAHVEVRKDDGHRRRFGLHRAPELEVLYLALTAMLSRDHSGLTRHFEIDIDGTASSWQLELRPRDETLAHGVKSMLLCGGAGKVRQFSLHLPDGETIHTRLHHAP